jgi:hypothetical protein
MKDSSFSARLQSLMRHGNLTGADLARWFNRPDPTVRGWISGEHKLGGAALDTAYIIAQLVRLEKMLKKHQGLPVPQLTPSARIKYVNGLITLR